jgi:hypothetical protein
MEAPEAQVVVARVEQLQRKQALTAHLIWVAVVAAACMSVLSSNPAINICH